MRLPKTYAEAGVDIDKEGLAIKKIVDHVKDTLKYARVLSSFGMYTGIIDLGEHAITLKCDGVGTKTLVAKELNRYDTIGIDAVAMVANDTICNGSKPLAMLDYIAMDKIDVRIVEEIARGLKEGAREAEVAIVGGELATMPDLINGIDVVAFMVGILKKEKIIDGSKICENDSIIGLESNGLHSNGFSLIRKTIMKAYDVKNDKKLADEILKPTKIYVRTVLDILKNVEVKGLSHITGGGLSNLNRLNKNFCFYLNNLPEEQEIFKLVKEVAKIDYYEMYRTFNMGIGFCIICDERYEQDVIDICRKHGIKAYKIGKVIKGSGVVIKKENIELRYTYHV